MENFKINCNPSERDAIISVLSASNDVIINTIEMHSIGITIQHDNAETFYETLLEKIATELRKRNGTATTVYQARDINSIH